MASAADLSDSPAPAPAVRKGFGLGALLAVSLVSVSASGGVAWWLMREPAAGSEAATGPEAGETVELPAPAAYLPVEPAFVVNLSDPEIPHYLQVDVQVMSRDALALESVRTHLPHLRNSLLLLFGQQKPADLSTREGKERLRALALAEVQAVMKAETGQPVVEDVFFTSFVMQ